MRDLCENGTVHMKPLGAYLSLESNVIGDPNEGLSAYYSSKNPTLKVTMKVGEQVLPLTSSDLANIRVGSSTRHHAVYCMAGITVPGDGTFGVHRDLVPFLSDRRLLDFGDTVVVFKNSQEFARRLDAAAKAAGHELDVEGPGPVTYVSEDYCGRLDPYTKIGEYAYQQEFRFMTERPIEAEFINLNLGSLMDTVLFHLDPGDFRRIALGDVREVG